MESEPLKIETPAEAGGITRKGVIAFVFALCCFVAAYLFVCLVPIDSSPLGFFVLTAAFYLVTAIAALLLGGRIRAVGVLALVLGLVTAAYRLVHGSVSFDLFPVFVLSFLCYGLFAVSLFGNTGGGLGGAFLLDIVKGFVYMFTAFADFFVAVFRPEGTKRTPKKLLIAAAGIVISIILVLIVGGLLSFDAHFTELLPKLEIDDVLRVFLKLFLTVPIAAMTFSMLASSMKHKLGRMSRRETVDGISEKTKVIPVLIIALPIFSVLAVYVLFFVSQWAYYMSAFTGTLPEGYSFAEYAREGFFNLCVVALINAVLIIVLSSFAGAKGKGGAAVVSILKILLSLATLVLIATAVSKMLIYIGAYDLTRDRLAVTVFLVFLALAFLAVIVSTVFKKVKAIPVIVVIACASLIAFSLVDTNRLIAKYNVDSYLGGNHANIDVAYLESDLGLSAVPELERLAENAKDPDVKAAAGRAITNIRKENSDLKWYEMSIPYRKARGTFDKSGKQRQLP